MRARSSWLRSISSTFRLEAPDRVACLSLRFQIAQKIHAVTERPADGRPNLRHWDLIDIILLRAIAPKDLAGVRTACRAIFKSRATHNWPPTLDVVELWREPYLADVERMGTDLPSDVDAAAEEVRRFIAEIERAR